MEAFKPAAEKKEQVVSPAERAEALATQREVIDELHQELENSFGRSSKDKDGEQVNVTGAKLEEANALAKQLGEEIDKLNEMVADYARDRSAMPEVPPEGYGGVAQDVPAAEQQFRAPALKEQTTVADVNQQRAA